MIYLDNAATTYPKPEEVYKALDDANRHLAFNAGRGESNESDLATKTVDKARDAVASLLNPGLSRSVVFTSSATDALNKLVLGLDLLEGDTVYISPFEHNAIVRPLRRFESQGVKIKILPFDQVTWKVNSDLMQEMFALDNPRAVLISHVSNVTGYELPYREIFEESSKYGSVNILDAAQSYGVFPIDSACHMSYLVFAGHKSLYGSFGVAGFIVLDDCELAPVVCGGTGSDSLNPSMPKELPYRYEAGSLNVVAISSLIPSIQFLHQHDVGKHERLLAALFVDRLKKMNKIHVFFPDGCAPNGIVSIGIEGYSSSDVGVILKSKGISVRTGYHCAPLVHDFIGSDLYEGTVRFSFGAFNSFSDVEKTLEILGGLVYGAE